MYAFPLRAVTFLFTGGKHFWNDYVYLLNVRRENQQLRTSLDLRTEQNVQMKELLLENERLRKLLLLKERSSAKLISAEVIGRDAIGWLKTILINKGENDNVYKDQAVVTHQGIVGRCIEVADTTTRVLLITDINSSVDALVQRTRSRGIVEGTGSGMCELKYIAGTDDLKKGDLVVTAGLCGIFPKGLSIGRVKKVEKNPYVLFQSVELEPSSNLNTLEEVSLLLPAGD
jgi:rod shape-determining protein MreC